MEGAWNFIFRQTFLMFLLRATGILRHLLDSQCSRFRSLGRAIYIAKEGRKGEKHVWPPPPLLLCYHPRKWSLAGSLVGYDTKQGGDAWHSNRWCTLVRTVHVPVNACLPVTIRAYVYIGPKMYGGSTVKICTYTVGTLYLQGDAMSPVSACLVTCTVGRYT